MLHDLSVVQVAKMLRNLEVWLDKGVAHAESRSWDPELLLAARLAPDQYPLLKQVQAACDAAKALAARIAGVEVPSHPDEEKTLAEVRERIHKTLAFLETVGPDQLHGGEARELALPFLGEKRIKGQDYVAEMAVPNFYFHVVTAYSILRHAGVALGKRVFIGSMKVYDPQ